MLKPEAIMALVTREILKTEVNVRKLDLECGGGGRTVHANSMLSCGRRRDPGVHGREMPTIAFLEFRNRIFFGSGPKVESTTRATSDDYFPRFGFRHTSTIVKTLSTYRHDLKVG